MAGAIKKPMVAISTLLSEAHHKNMKLNDFNFGVSKDTQRPDKLGRASEKASGIYRSVLQECD